MAYDLDQFMSDCRAILSRDPGPQGREEVRVQLERLLQNPDFVRKHCGDAPRGLHMLYDDPEARLPGPRAHQREGARVAAARPRRILGDLRPGDAYTDMTEWERVDDGCDPKHAKLKPTKKYRLTPGQAGIYQDGAIHSIDYPDDPCSSALPAPTSTASRVRFDLEDRRGETDDAAAGDVSRAAAPTARQVPPARLKAMLADGGELALLDVREELLFSQSHLLLARSLPLSRLELRVPAAGAAARAPASCSCDGGDGLADARRAILLAHGYTDLSVLEGGSPPGEGGLRALLGRQRAKQGVRRIGRARERHTISRRQRAQGACATARIWSCSTAGRSTNIRACRSRPRPMCRAPTSCCASAISRLRRRPPWSSIAPAARAASSARNR